MTTLRQWLLDNGLSLRAFAARCKCSPPAMTRYAAGGAIPRPHTMRRIYVETDGAVDPNSFYDLPPLADARLSQLSEGSVMGNGHG